MAKHLMDETAEFKMPTIGRHVMNDETEAADATRPLDAAAHAWVPRRHESDGQAS